MAPDGRAVMVLSGCGGAAKLVSFTLLFQDGATRSASSISNGATFGFSLCGNPSAFPSPAPSAANSQTFAGARANGVWQLYVLDHAKQDEGSLAGWELSITAGAPTTTLQPPPSTLPPTTTDNRPFEPYNITYVFDATSVTPTTTFTNALTTAINTIQSIVVRGLADVGAVDDLQITIKIAAVDGPGGVLGFAGPSALRTCEFETV